VKLVDISFGEAIQLGAENFALHRSDAGMISTSWNHSDAIDLEAGDVLFTLEFEALDNAELRNTLTINSTMTAAEAYNSLDQVSEVALHFGDKAVNSNEFVLYQNRPNPFTESTVVGFNLPEADYVKITVFDVTGKTVHIESGDFEKGYNEVKMSSKDIKAKGVLYYQIDTQAFTATKKMIHLK
jgi:hypothetical protein